MKTFPIHVVCEWIGNTPNVALKHYLQVLPEDFERAVRGGAGTVQKAVQSGVANERQEGTRLRQSPENMGSSQPLPLPVNYCPDVRVTLRGFEPRSLP